jgi:hypothetical protein
MKKLFNISILVALLLIAIPVMAAAPPPATYPLVVDGNIQVGQIVVHNVGLGVTVEFVVTEPGWEITETHLATASSPSAIPQKKGNPVLKDFPIITIHKPPVTEVGYHFFFENWDPVTMVAHAKIVNNHKKMDAWGRGEASEIFDGKNSVPYFTWYYPWD